MPSPLHDVILRLKLAGFIRDVGELTSETRLSECGCAEVLHLFDHRTLLARIARNFSTGATATTFSPHVAARM